MPMTANNRVIPRSTMRINVRVAGTLVAEKRASVNSFRHGRSRGGRSPPPGLRDFAEFACGVNGISITWRYRFWLHIFGSGVPLHINIVTPAWNCAALIGDTIRSVLRQTHADWSMVVVDDGSTDGTGDVVRRFSDPRLRLLTQGNAGVSAARNRGMALLDGDGVLFLDADDVLTPTALATLADGLDDAPWAVAVAGSWARLDPTRPDQAGRRVCPPDGDVLERLLVRNRYVNGGHLLIRSEAVRQTGAFREDMRFGEDWEYWIRLALLGEFDRVRDRTPLLLVRERIDGAYASQAFDTEVFRVCLDATFAVPGLAGRLGTGQLGTGQLGTGQLGTGRLGLLRDLAEADTAWVVGRELIRRDRASEGRRWLWRSVRAAPASKRVALLAASVVLPCLPSNWRGPFRPYRAAGADQAGARAPASAAVPDRS